MNFAISSLLPRDGNREEIVQKIKSEKLSEKKVNEYGAADGQYRAISRLLLTAIAYLALIFIPLALLMWRTIKESDS